MSESDIQVILFRLESMDKKIDEIVADQKIASKSVCPNPGACVNLQKDVDRFKEDHREQETRLRSLESLRDEAKGAGIVAKAIWAFIGAGGIGIVIGLAQLLQK